jgi:hypothetical protein
MLFASRSREAGDSILVKIERVRFPLSVFQCLRKNPPQLVSSPNDDSREFAANFSHCSASIR